MSAERAMATVVQHDLRVLTWWCQRQPAGVHLEVVCAESPTLPGPQEQRVVRLTGCLWDAGAADLVELAAATRSVVLRIDGCAHAVTGSATRQVVEVLAALGAADRVQVWGRVPDDAQVVPDRVQHGVRTLPAPRRALFAWARPALAASKQDIDEPADRGLVDALRALLDGAPIDAAADRLSSDALHLHSGGCTACGTCVKACPTDALTLRETAQPGGQELVLDLSGCIGCTTCLTLCPADALHSTGPASWGRLLEGPDEIVLEKMPTRTCRRCRTDFAGGPAERALCPVCTDRRADPFGSTLPPGYVAPHR